MNADRERLEAAMRAAIEVYVARGVDEVAEEMATILQKALDEGDEG